MLYQEIISLHGVSIFAVFADTPIMNLHVNKVVYIYFQIYRKRKPQSQIYQPTKCYFPLKHKYGHHKNTFKRFHGLLYMIFIWSHYESQTVLYHMARLTLIFVHMAP